MPGFSKKPKKTRVQRRRRKRGRRGGSALGKRVRKLEGINRIDDTSVTYQRELNLGWSKNKYGAHTAALVAGAVPHADLADMFMDNHAVGLHYGGAGVGYSGRDLFFPSYMSNKVAEKNKLPLIAIPCLPPLPQLKQWSIDRPRYAPLHGDDGPGVGSRREATLRQHNSQQSLHIKSIIFNVTVKYSTSEGVINHCFQLVQPQNTPAGVRAWDNVYALGQQKFVDAAGALQDGADGKAVHGATLCRALGECAIGEEGSHYAYFQPGDDEKFHNESASPEDAYKENLDQRPSGVIRFNPKYFKTIYKKTITTHVGKGIPMVDSNNLTTGGHFGGDISLGSTDARRIAFAGGQAQAGAQINPNVMRTKKFRITVPYKFFLKNKDAKEWHTMGRDTFGLREQTTLVYSNNNMFSGESATIRIQQIIRTWTDGTTPFLQTARVATTAGAIQFTAPIAVDAQHVRMAT